MLSNSLIIHKVNNQLMTAISVSGWISIRNETLDYSDQNPIFWANEQPFNTTQLRSLNLIYRFQMDQICMLSIGLFIGCQLCDFHSAPKIWKHGGFLSFKFTKRRRPWWSRMMWIVLLALLSLTFLGHNCIGINGSRGKRIHWRMWMIFVKLFTLIITE